MIRKDLIQSILSIFDPMELIPVLLDFLEDQASKTANIVDDTVVAAMRAAAMQIWPELFD